MEDFNDQNKLPRFQPIVFADGTQYTSQEVEWVVNDYLAAAERSVGKRRNAARYQMKLRGTAESTDQLPVEITEREQFIAKVKAANEYKWIVAVAQVRNELDPMHALRVKIYSADRVGGSTMEIMVKHIDDVLRNTKSDYGDRARAKDYIKIINDLGKKWNPSLGVPVFDFSITEATKTTKGITDTPKRVNGPDDEPVEKTTIKTIRATAATKRQL